MASELDPSRSPATPSGVSYNVELGRWEHLEGDGPFAVFHPNGQPAFAGTAVEGELEGEVIAYRSDGPTDFKLRACCVPAGAWELRTKYRAGRVLRQVFYDREGRPLASDGSPWPERPAGIGEEVDYDEDTRLWLHREERPDGSYLHRYFTQAGLAWQEIEYRNGYKDRERGFDARGQLCEEKVFDAEGRFHGASRRWFARAELNPYLDDRVREEHGQFEQGRPVGTFTWKGAENVPVACRELGHLLDEQALRTSIALSTEVESWPAERIWALVQDLRREGRLREALCAAARAAARERSAAALKELLESCTLQHKPELAEQRGQQLLEARDVTALGTLDELLLGTDPAAAYRTLAAILPGSRRVALEFVEASLLLAPEQRSIHVTRALLRLETGDTRGALEDAELLSSDSSLVAEHLRTSVRLYFSEFPFSPLGEPLDPALPETPEVEPAQPLARIQHQVRVYATRLARMRRAVLDFLGACEAPPWCPPDLTYLLSDGPVELRHTTVTVTDETDQGPEIVEVIVDETLELAGVGLTTLMRVARAEWAALCWLCWSVGMDHVGVPESVAAPLDFPSAVNRAIERAFRAKDQLQSGGLVSRSRGVPSFTWEGIPVDELDSTFAALAANEYLEIRSMFVWILFEANVSPFQSDIRTI